MNFGLISNLLYYSPSLPFSSLEEAASSHHPRWRLFIVENEWTYLKACGEAGAVGRAVERIFAEPGVYMVEGIEAAVNRLVEDVRNIPFFDL